MAMLRAHSMCFIGNYRVQSRSIQATNCARINFDIIGENFFILCCCWFSSISPLLSTWITEMCVFSCVPFHLLIWNSCQQGLKLKSTNNKPSTTRYPIVTPELCELPLHHFFFGEKLSIFTGITILFLTETLSFCCKAAFIVFNAANLCQNHTRNVKLIQSFPKVLLLSMSWCALHYPIGLFAFFIFIRSLFLLSSSNRTETEHFFLSLGSKVNNNNTLLNQFIASIAKHV